MCVVPIHHKLKLSPGLLCSMGSRFSVKYVITNYECWCARLISLSSVRQLHCKGCKQHTVWSTIYSTVCNTPCWVQVNRLPASCLWIAHFQLILTAPMATHHRQHTSNLGLHANIRVWHWHLQNIRYAAITYFTLHRMCRITASRDALAFPTQVCHPRGCHSWSSSKLCCCGPA